MTYAQVHHKILANTDPSIFILGTRSAAAPIRARVEAALAGDHADVRIDFSGVDVTQSFVDELLGVLILRHGETVLRRLAFEGCSDDTRAIIKFVARSRARDFKHLAETGELPDATEYGSPLR